jgi:hypothetical protein
MSLDQTIAFAADVARSQQESPPVVMLVVIVSLQLVVGLILWRVFRYGGPDDDDPGRGGDGPGWGRRRPRKPPPDQPVCWPEFERQFAEYVAGLHDGARDR